MDLADVGGVEPPSLVLETSALPLSYTPAWSRCPPGIAGDVVRIRRAGPGMQCHLELGFAARALFGDHWPIGNAPANAGSPLPPLRRLVVAVLRGVPDHSATGYT